MNSMNEAGKVEEAVPAGEPALTDEQILAEMSKRYYPSKEVGNSLLERIYPHEIVAGVRALLAAPPAPHDCTRSHPHELMSADCERKTVDAREANRQRCAELSEKSAAPPAQVAIPSDMLMACGHPSSMHVVSVESGAEYCAVCDLRSMLDDALSEEARAKAEIVALKAQIDAAPAAVAIPSGMVLMPRELTAENGAKSALSGEFAESVTVECPECYHDDVDDKLGCEVCSGSGEWTQDVPVEWDTVKRIYRKAVETLAAAPSCAPDKPTTTLTGLQVRNLIQFVAPDMFDADQLETEVSFQHMEARTSTEDGEPMPAGLYAWITDYPEEGCICLDDPLHTNATKG